jgi:putative flavoprotein involved in K+ transport
VRRLDVVVIGAGQAGLAVGYYLRRTNLSHVLLDASPSPGGAWPHTWPSLKLFSPAEASSLPGWLMASTTDGYPTRDAVVDYLTRYEHRYELPVRRPMRVHAVRRSDHGMRVETDAGAFHARAVVSATGTAGAPHVPRFPGRDSFAGRQLHSVDYRGPESFAGQRVLIVGAGNSAAQILAEVSRVADTTWATHEPPRFMPDHVDGRALFAAASRRYREQNGAGPAREVHGLGDIVMVDSVKDARRRGVLVPRPLPDRLVPDGAVWRDGRFRRVDAVIWCTGFAPALDHLAPLRVTEPDGQVLVDGTQARCEPRLWLVGYGGWTGFASATLIGVGRSARRTVAQIDQELARPRYLRSA